MAYPRRHSRKIAVNGEDYVWHMNHNDLTFGQTQITIGHAKCPKWFLHIDPYPVVTSPATVRSAILWALDQGWIPTSPHEPMFITQREGEFLWFPYANRMDHPESSQSGWLSSMWNSGIPAEQFAPPLIPPKSD